MAEKDLGNAFFGGVALLSLAVTSLGVIMWLRPRTTSLGSREPAPVSGLSVDIPKVHYDDSQVLVSVRSPGEWHELREFIQPANPDILRIVGNLYE
jgi:hypothetical protein